MSYSEGLTTRAFRWQGLNVVVIAQSYSVAKFRFIEYKPMLFGGTDR